MRISEHSRISCGGSRAALLYCFPAIIVACAGQSSSADKPAYVLAAKDEITVHSVQVKEMADKTFRLDDARTVNFPLIGRVDFSGDTLEQAEKIVLEKCRK